MCSGRLPRRHDSVHSSIQRTKRPQNTGLQRGHISQPCPLPRPRVEERYSCSRLIPQRTTGPPASRTRLGQSLNRTSKSLRSKSAAASLQCHSLNTRRPVRPRHCRLVATTFVPLLGGTSMERVVHAHCHGVALSFNVFMTDDDLRRRSSPKHLSTWLDLHAQIVDWLFGRASILDNYEGHGLGYCCPRIPTRI